MVLVTVPAISMTVIVFVVCDCTCDINDGDCIRGL